VERLEPAVVSVTAFGRFAQGEHGNSPVETAGMNSPELPLNVPAQAALSVAVICWHHSNKLN
jgi:hypothetical protein